MAGQIIKRGDKTWLVRIFKGRDAEGKRLYMNKTIKGNKKDAETYLNKTLTDISTGTFIEPSSETLSAYLDRWLAAAVRPRVRERTFVDYVDKLDRYIRPLLGGHKLSELRPLDIQRAYADLQARPLAPRTIRYAHSILASALKQAVLWHVLPRNPCDVVELPRHVRREMRALAPDEAARFLEAAREDRFGVLFAFALTTGMRPEEYLGLQWKDVDLEKGTAMVCRTVVWRAGGGWYFGEPKTSRSRRTIPLPASLVRQLAAHRREQAAVRLKAGAEYQNNDLVFATSEGTPVMLRNLIRRHFRPTLLRAKLPTVFRLYDLRHSCATLLLAANEHPKVVSERLGHASITLTLDTYSHVLPSMQQAATDKLEKLLFRK